MGGVSLGDIEVGNDFGAPCTHFLHPAYSLCGGNGMGKGDSKDGVEELSRNTLIN